MHTGKLVLAALAIMILSGILLYELGMPAASRAIGAEEIGDSHENLPASVVEARGRARLLHETIQGTLQVVHRDLFREDEALAIPSQSFEDVFHELARSFRVELRWLAINTKAMDIDHEPQSQFEKDAANAIKSGKTEFDLATTDTYQFVGSIRLSSRCLKCHLPLRSSNDDRAAGLLIKMPIKKP